MTVRTRGQALVMSILSTLFVGLAMLIPKGTGPQQVSHISPLQMTLRIYEGVMQEVLSIPVLGAAVATMKTQLRGLMQMVASSGLWSTMTTTLSWTTVRPDQQIRRQTQGQTGLSMHKLLVLQARVGEWLAAQIERLTFRPGASPLTC